MLYTEIRRRQQLCRAEYGNWWDRLHSTVRQSSLKSLPCLFYIMSFTVGLLFGCQE